MIEERQPHWLQLFPDKDFDFRFGIRPGDVDSFFADTSEHDCLMASREQTLTKAPECHLFETSQAEEAISECIDWVKLQEGGCRSLALHWEPDFLILLPDENDRFIFRAGAVCFPSSWRPEEKVGLPIYDIHAPVPTLNDNLGSQIDKFFSNLEPGNAWERSNWGLSGSAELNQHPARDIPRMIPPFKDTEAWVRIEDQMLYRLPQSRALLFGIRLVNVQLTQLKKFPEALTGLCRAIATMPDEVAEYKNIRDVRSYLLDLLAG